MCGQIFCNQCSSHYIDGVRACRLCHDQLSERYERDNKLFRRRMSGSLLLTDVISSENSRPPRNDAVASRDNQMLEQAAKDKKLHMNNLQNRWVVWANESKNGAQITNKSTLAQESILWTVLHFLIFSRDLYCVVHNSY